jgi:SAM-dependent methyltransferase
MAPNDEFLDPLCTYRTIANFIPRRAVLNALIAELRNFHGVVLDIGCGRKPYQSILLAPPSRAVEYIGLDLKRGLRHPAYEQCERPDVEWDGRIIPLDGNSVDCALATEVLTQCPEPEVLMREAIRVLKPGGLFFFTVQFLWAIHDAPYDQGRPTPFALERQLHNSGFQKVEMRALGGWDASLAQMLGLWVGRKPMGRIKRRILKVLTLPLISYLLKKDEPLLPSSDFEGTVMITGIAGTANKPGQTG